MQNTTPHAGCARSNNPPPTPDVVQLTDDDVIETIKDFCARRGSDFAPIALLGTVLNLTDDEGREWLRGCIAHLDMRGRVMLRAGSNALPGMQVWAVRDAHGAECHEVGTGFSSRFKVQGSQWPRNTMPPPPWPRAVDESTHNPTVQQRRITRLVRGAAETLQGLGARTPASAAKLFHAETQTGEAA